MLLHQAFGLSLRQHQRIGVWRLDRIQPDMGDLAAVGDDIAGGCPTNEGPQPVLSL
jgi:hypothetical protein